MTLLLPLDVLAQGKISGKIVDEQGEPIPYASVSYKGNHVAVVSNINGQYSIARHAGWKLTFSAVGFAPQEITVDKKLSEHNVTLKEEESELTGVVVKSKRGRYKRKDNPAIELMRRVIAAKKQTDLSRHDYYAFDKYQKITLSFNNIKKDSTENKFLRKHPNLWSQVEVSPYNGQLILPISIDETVTQHVYRKSPKSEKDIIRGQQSTGIGNLIETGSMVNDLLKEVFTDVDIYDDHVRLFQYHFPSPIGSTAISFYHFYIEDTTYVDQDSCYHLQFIPANKQDFGFRGELYVLADSSLHVRRCNLYLPQSTGVNWVKNMKIDIEYSKLDNGEWVMTQDDMSAELHVVKGLRDLFVVRNTRLNNYHFEPLPKAYFRGKAAVKHDAYAMNRDDDYWNQYRNPKLTKSESSMDSFLKHLSEVKGYKWIMAGVKVLLENYMETSSETGKSKFDFGPLNTFVSHNFVDGMRLRVAGRTKAALNPHWFWSGYGAYGTESHKWYYGSDITWSFNKKKTSWFEYPQRSLTFSTSYDVESPSDQFLLHNKDNVLMSFKSASQRRMYFYNRQALRFDYESDGGFRLKLGVQTESNEATGRLHYVSMDGYNVKKFRKTFFTAELKYNPGVTYVNTKQQRFPINLDSPELYISHEAGVKHFLGGQYNSNITAAGIYYRLWLGSWGFINMHLDGKVQWNKVPFPFLIMPPTNLTYVEDETVFSLMKDYEFLNDRQVFWSVKWDMNGKLLSRIPLLRKLKWREYIGFKGIYGQLSDKNNPLYAQNAGSRMLFRFPEYTHAMSGKPYWEVQVGVHNIFKFLAIEYVRRITYNENVGSDKWGIRFGLEMSF